MSQLIGLWVNIWHYSSVLISQAMVCLPGFWTNIILINIVYDYGVCAQACLSACLAVDGILIPRKLLIAPQSMVAIKKHFKHHWHSKWPGTCKVPGHLLYHWWPISNTLMWKLTICALFVCEKYNHQVLKKRTYIVSWRNMYFSIFSDLFLIVTTGYNP